MLFLQYTYVCHFGSIQCSLFTYIWMHANFYFQQNSLNNPKSVMQCSQGAWGTFSAMADFGLFKETYPKYTAKMTRVLSSALFVLRVHNPGEHYACENGGRWTETVCDREALTVYISLLWSWHFVAIISLDLKVAVNFNS